MKNVSPSSGDLAAKISKSLKETGKDEEMGKKIGDRLSSIEDEYMKALGDPKAKEGETAQLEIKYRRAMRTYEAFQRLMQNAHEMMMRAIQGLAIR
jgi:hypothetical protein